MNKLDEIKVFVQKNAAFRAELADSMTNSSYNYSLAVAEDIIEQQQELKRQANRLQILSVNKPFFEEAEFEIHLNFNEFTSFIDLDECKENVWEKEEAIYHRYSILIDNIALFALKKVTKEEHKNAQAI